MKQRKASIWWGPPRKFSSLIEERKISWLELFYDLVYVVAISKITHHFAEHPDLIGLIGYAYLFSMIFWGWFNGSIYHDLHGSPGIRTRLMTLWQMIALAALIICLSGPADTVSFRGTIGLMILQLYITYVWWSVGIYDKAHRVYNRPYTICFLLALVLLFSTFFINEQYTKIIFWTALVLNYLPPFLVIGALKRSNEDFSLSLSMVERLGLFTIIVFGETMLGVINGTIELHKLNAMVWVNFSVAVFIVFALWWIFFSLVADRESRRGYLNATFIEISYVPTLASLGILAASFPGLFQNFEHPENAYSYSVKLFFGASLSVFLFGVTLISRFLQYPEQFLYAKRTLRSLLIIVGIVVLLLTILANGISLLTYLLIIFILLLVVIIILTRIWFKAELKQYEDSKEAV